MITKNRLIVQQRGAALVVALIMLVLMTLVGVTAMQVTTVQQKMVTNSRDLNTAFQAAETALMRGEAYLVWINPGRAEVEELFTLNGSTSGLYLNTPEKSSDPQWLEAVGTNLIWAKDSKKTLEYGNEPTPAGAGDKIPDISPLPSGTVAKQPRFMIECINCVTIGMGSSGDSGSKEKYFRITAQGYGQAQGDDGEPLSRVMLQSLRKSKLQKND